MTPPSINPARQAERRFARTVLLLIALGFAAVLFAGMSAVAVMARGEEASVWIDHTHQVEREVSVIRLALEQMRSSRRGALLGLSTSGGVTYADASVALFDGIEHVRKLTVDNPVQQVNIERLTAMAGQLDKLFRQSMIPGSTHMVAAEAERQLLALQVQSLATRMLAIEQRLLVERNAARATALRLFYVVLAVTGVLVLLVAAGSIWVIRRYTGELSDSREELRSLNENLEQAVAIRTVDLQRANEEIQRFAYIVSHDLRSPLVNVMGFTAELDAAIKPLSDLIDKAEVEAPALVDQEIKLTVREDLPEAIGFIRTSTQKMDRLINAILQLSRQGRRTITAERLDLGDLCKTVIDALRHRIDELGVVVEIAPDLPELVSDRLAVEQIVSNLVENAVKYLKPGRPGEIRIGGRVQNGRVLLDVADNGRGIEKRDHERVFDLFRRSGMQDQPGEGIGLAHVRALAYRLGGTITLASELGEGATFTLNLPVLFTGEKTH